MRELLARLLALFTTEMIDNNDYLQSIHILDDFSMEVILNTEHLPALVISPVGERHEQGPFANTSREYYSIRLRIVARSSETYAYMVDPLSGTTTNKTVFELTDIIRDILYENKRLVSSTFEMTPQFNVTDLAVIWGGSSGQYSARDINIEYTNLELYTGMANTQDHLEPAYQF